MALETNPEPVETLSSYIESINEKLDIAGRESASQAFNLGCTVGIIPAALVVIITFFASSASWLAALVIGILMIVALIGLANLVAFIARTKTLERVYRTEINPGIEQALARFSVTRTEFDQLANDQLPESAVLRRFIKPVTDGAPEESIQQ